jgi:hypothetical protein
MKRIQLILNCAIAVFAFSTTISGSLLVFGQKKPNYFNITIPASAARLAFGLGMLGTGSTMLLASRIEAAELRELLKPRPVPTPCRGCRNFHGVEYNGIPLNCAIHPEGWQGDKCPDWQAFNHLNKEQENDVNSR